MHAPLRGVWACVRVGVGDLCGCVSLVCACMRSCIKEREREKEREKVRERFD